MTRASVCVLGAGQETERVEGHTFFVCLLSVRNTFVGQSSRFGGFCLRRCVLAVLGDHQLWTYRRAEVIIGVG